MKRRSNTAANYYLIYFSLFLFIDMPCAAGLILNYINAAKSGAGRSTFGILWLPFLIITGVNVYCLVQYIYYRSVSLTDLQRVILKDVGDDRNWGTVGFWVDAEIDGCKRRMLTKPVFSTSPYMPNYIQAFKGRAALVGYDKNRGELIVISK